ncbi:MAG TPA: hypothetical protein VF547_11805 [Allosphingosinicella sp.]|jgi:hypothetical protein
MNVRSSAQEMRNQLETSREQLEAIQASDRHLVLTSTASITAICVVASMELLQFLALVRPPIASPLDTFPVLKVAAGAIALLCVAYIAFSLYRRRRDVVRNDIRALRQQIDILVARGAWTSDGPASGASL